MRVDLIKYMSDRLKQEGKNEKEPGPVITISRLYGCPGRKIAQKLAEELTKKMQVRGSNIQWNWISKEIMTESAKQLEMDPSKIEYVFNYEQKGLIDDIISAHSQKYYKSDRKIRSSIAKVIRNIGTQGHVIIVGRGSVAITHDIPKSLHLNFVAPLEWRVLRISEKQGITFEEAEIKALDIDKKRKLFRENFEGKNSDYTDFDLTFNCMTLSINEIVKIIVKAVETRELY